MGLAYVYLGYWIEGSDRMRYKVRYRPLERLGCDGWERFAPDVQDELIANSAAPSERTGAIDDSGKDGISAGQGKYQFQQG